jgi:hypothetical protein
MGPPGAACHSPNEIPPECVVTLAGFREPSCTGSGAIVRGLHLGNTWAGQRFLTARGSSRNVRHKQPIRHSFLEVPDHAGLGSWDRDREWSHSRRQLLANGAMATFVFRIGPVSREGAGYSRSRIKSRWRSNASSVIARVDRRFSASSIASIAARTPDRSALASRVMAGLATNPS